MLAGLGVSWLLFRNIGLRGWGFGRLIGLLITGYTVWILSMIGVLSSSLLSWWSVTAAFSTISVVVIYRNRQEFFTFLRRNTKLILISEVLFATFFAAFALFKAYDPGIFGTEKPMELMLLASSWLAEAAPPEDAWFAGEPIAYYYFGYWMFAGLSHMSGVAPAYGFNLALASLPALASPAAFGLIVAIAHGTRKISNSKSHHGGKGSSYQISEPSSSKGYMQGRAMILAGLFGVALLLLAGSAVGWWEGLAHFGVGSTSLYEWLAIDGLELSSGQPFRGEFGSWRPQDYWWWWRASRVINSFDEAGRSLDFTIQEFPAFSYLLGDLHPHVMSLPFFLLTLGTILTVWRSSSPWGFRWLVRHKLSAIALAFLIGAAGFINLWDVLFISALLWMVCSIKVQDENPGQNLLLASLYALPPVLLLVLVGFAGFAPFYPPFGSSEGGLLYPYIGAVETGTRPIHFLTVWGFFGLILLPPAIVFIWRRLQPDWQRSGSERNTPELPASSVSRGSLSLFIGLLLAVPLSIWALGILFANRSFNPNEEFSLFGGQNPIVIFNSEALVLDNLFHLGLPAILSVLFFLFLRLSAQTGIHRDDPLRFVFLLTALSIYVLYVAEFIFAVDVFGNRMNTVFKVYYEVWIALSVASAVVLFRAMAYRIKWQEWRMLTMRIAWAMVLLMALVGPFYYTAAAFVSKTSTSVGFGEGSFNGLAWLEDSAPSDIEAARWLSRNVDKEDTILEGVGGSFTNYGRLSSITGIPSLLGWSGHEVQWRADDAAVYERELAARSLYTTSDEAEAWAILDKWGINYIVVSCREHDLYPELRRAAILRMDEQLTLVFDSESLKGSDALGGCRVQIYKSALDLEAST